PVLVADRGAVRVITVHRPDKLNALNAATLDALSAAFAAAAADEAVRCVGLTGAGPKAFVAGADIAEMDALTPVQRRDFSLRGEAALGCPRRRRVGLRGGRRHRRDEPPGPGPGPRLLPARAAAEADRRDPAKAGGGDGQRLRPRRRAGTGHVLPPAHGLRDREA